MSSMIARQKCCKSCSSAMYSMSVNSAFSMRMRHRPADTPEDFGVVELQFWRRTEAAGVDAATVRWRLALALLHHARNHANCPTCEV